MPGLLSTIFDGADPEGGSESTSSAHSADVGTDLHLEPSITIESHMSGSYEALDGTTHSWERVDSVTLEADTQIVTHVAVSLVDSAMTEEGA